MAPLIDCVFLLLIFFLVTTMIRRKEKLIPIRLPDMTAAVAESARDAALVIGLDREGRIYEGRRNNHEPRKTSGDNEGRLLFHPIPDFDAWLAGNAPGRGEPLDDRPIRIEADRSLPFQKVVAAIDALKERGFVNVGIRTRLQIDTVTESLP